MRDVEVNQKKGEGSPRCPFCHAALGSPDAPTWECPGCAAV
jgi:hypothetical protein